MPQKMTQAAVDVSPFEDPIANDPAFQQTESRMAIWGHPLHAMSVAFPVALTFCVFGADLLYWWSGETRWAWAALWAAGTAFLFGLLAGASDTMELLLVPGIRIRAAAWTHFVVGMGENSYSTIGWEYRRATDAPVAPEATTASAVLQALAWPEQRSGSGCADDQTGNGDGRHQWLGRFMLAIGFDHGNDGVAHPCVRRDKPRDRHQPS
ncbi:DUF2231 domain-containing protein [Tabrizicola sp. BL-A-41-H6]|uniref:DUF2231 domain-containing protein n=1 Tax=Tabrizicola sp. BL-A-41-H6 TaxID=3421107 RepID=UPI003D66ED79